MTSPFVAYEVRTRALFSRPSAPEWMHTLRSRVGSERISGGDNAPIICGDPHDGLALVLGEYRWGAPNPWLKKKGLDPMHTLRLFAPIRAAGAGTRCLVPATGFFTEPDEAARVDSTRAWMTLAGLVTTEMVEPDRLEGGFCILTDKVRGARGDAQAALVVGGEHHDEWMDSWKELMDVANCTTPIELALGSFVYGSFTGPSLK